MRRTRWTLAPAPSILSIVIVAVLVVLVVTRSRCGVHAGGEEFLRETAREDGTGGDNRGLAGGGGWDSVCGLAHNGVLHEKQQTEWHVCRL